MKLLLDESLPRFLKQDLQGHQVTTVPERGWAGKDNGALLRLPSLEFDVFLTADQGIEYQQSLGAYEIAVVTLAPKSNRAEDLRPLMPRVLDMVDELKPGDIVRVTI